MFFEHGVYRQQRSLTVGEANRNYKSSCKICCSKGYRMDCDRCPIENAHRQAVEVLQATRARILSMA